MILFARSAVHPRTAAKIVWLSGASDSFSSALSDAEERPHESFGVPREEIVRPYLPYTGPKTQRRVPLPVAGLSNVLQFLVATTPGGGAA